MKKTIINDLGYHNKMNANYLLDYQGENDISLEVSSLKEIVANNFVNDEANDDKVRKHSNHLTEIINLLNINL